MDLTPLTVWLNSLGPWGVIAAVVVTIAAPKVFDWVKKKLPALAAPTPKPAPPQGGGVLNPADPVPLTPAPSGPLANRPVLNLLLLALQQMLAARSPGRDPEQLVLEHLAMQLGTQAVAMGMPAEVPKG